MDQRLRMATVAGWGFADQALSSLTNFVLGFIVARTFDTEALGAFALVFNTYLLFLNIARPLAMEPLMIRFSGVPAEQWRRVTEAAVGLSLVIGLAGALATCTAGAVLGGVLGEGLVVTGMLLPGLLVQDSWRLAFFAAGRGRAALLNDLVWALVLFPGMALALLVLHLDVAGFIGVWGLSATAAAVVGVAQAGLVPRPDRAIGWLREQRVLAAPLTLESIVGVGGQQIASFGVAAVAGLATVGALRAAQLLLGPLLVVFQGVQLIAIPEGRRILRRSRMALRRACRWYGLAMASVVIAWGALMVLVPHDLGLLVLRDNWGPAQQVILPLAVAWGLGFAGAALVVGLRVLARGRRVVIAGVASSLLSGVGLVVGAAIAGAVGAAVGNAVGARHRLAGSTGSNWTGRSASPIRARERDRMLDAMRSRSAPAT